MPRPDRPTGARLWAFRLVAALGLPAALLLLLELSLRLLGVGADLSLVHQEGDRLLSNPRTTERFFPAPLAREPLAFNLAAQRPEGALRVLVVGGSAAAGTPEPAYGVAAMLEQQLRHALPGREVEVVNLALTAANSHVVLPVLEEAADRLEPDAVVIWTGNNEVVGPYGAASPLAPMLASRRAIAAHVALRSSRLGQLSAALQRALAGPGPGWRGMEMFLEQQVAADDPRLERGYQHFRGNVSSMLEGLQERGIPAVLCTVPVNLADSAPFASTDGRPSANSHWADAQRALAQGDSAAAREHFRTARDLDTLRFRADSRTNALLRELGTEHDVALVDLEAELDAASPLGVAGHESFWEHVHLDFAGNARASRAIAPALLGALGEAAPDSWADDARLARWLAFTPFDHGQQCGKVQQMLQAPPFPGRANNAQELERIAQRRAAQLERLQERQPRDLLQTYAVALQRSDHWLARFRFAEFLMEALGEAEAAVAELETIVARWPQCSAAWSRLADAHVLRKDYASAASALERSLDIREWQASAWNNLGLCRERLGDPAAARDCFRRAVELRDEPLFRENLARVS